MKRTFSVSLTTSEIHEYEIEANSTEEAESIAEQYYKDKEPGTVTAAEVEYSEAVPVTEGPMGEIVPDMETA